MRSLCLAGAVLAGLSLAAAHPLAQAKSGVTAIPGVRVGHHTLAERPTGCTVIIFDTLTTGGVSVRGSAPGTRETDLLDPSNLVDQVHAIVFSGGSAFGLDAATGVMRYLEENGVPCIMAPGRTVHAMAAVTDFAQKCRAGPAGAGRCARHARRARRANGW